LERQYHMPMSLSGIMKGQKKLKKKYKLVTYRHKISNLGKNFGVSIPKTSIELIYLLTYLKNHTFSTLATPFNITLAQFLHIPKRIFQTTLSQVKVIMPFVISNFTDRQLNWPQFFIIH
jgi:hypothetical protein